MATYEVPLRAESQTLSITLAGVTYNLAVLWRDDPGGQGGWFLDIYSATDVPILRGLPLVTGVGLLDQFAYKELGFNLYVQTDDDPLAAPTYENLGSTSHLYAVY